MVARSKEDEPSGCTVPCTLHLQAVRGWICRSFLVPGKDSVILAFCANYLSGINNQFLSASV